MRTPVSFAVVLVATTFLPAQNAEDRLVEAELLEVSAGDLERAMAAYKAIAADEKTPAPVKARALLALGRSQRKAGQLEAAKKTFADLIAAQPGEAETIRQAKGFLEELETGRARNPSFDWISDVEKSPEIQARVFDWTMQLVGSDTKAAAGAARQLLALGPIGLPVVERVLDASRDDTQRYLLAMIALRSGRLERLAQVLEAEDIGMGNELYRFSFGQYLASVREMPERERTRVLEAATGVPETPKNSIRRAALLLAAGDRQDLVRKVTLVEGSHLTHTGILGDALEREPALADTYAERAKDRALSLEVRRKYFYSLFGTMPAKLGPEHFQIVEELEGTDARHAIGSLEAAGRFDVLDSLAGGLAAKELLQHFQAKHRDKGNIREAPASWAPVLRKLRHLGKEAPGLLHQIAEVNDEAAAELAAILASRRDEAPAYDGYGARKDPAWTPSPRYAELMAGLLESDDPMTLAIALEALALAPKGVGPEVLPALERLVVTPPESHVREFAVYALLERFATRPETGPEVARIVLLQSQICEPFRHSESALPPRLGRVTHAHPNRPHATPLEWVSREVGVSTLTDLLPHVLALGTSEETRKLLECYAVSGFLGRKPSEAVLAVAARLETRAQRAAAVLLDQEGQALARAPQGLALLRSVATDRDAELEARKWALSLASQAAADWFDWPAFLAGDDPILASNPYSLQPALGAWLERQPPRVQETVLGKLAEKPALLGLRVLVYPRDRADRIQVLEAALGGRETEDAAAAELFKLREIHGPELYRKLLATRWGRGNGQLHERIRESLDESLIEPLVKLLDDPSPIVRTLALETLQTIRTALEQKKEWQLIVETLKARKKE